MLQDPILSIIIPLSHEEESFDGLLYDLKFFSKYLTKHISWEVVLVPGHGFLDKNNLEKECEVFSNCSLFYSKEGRAEQLNLGADKARGKHLWFLHSDSRLERKTLEKLLYGLRTNPNDLLYFDLKFSKDGPFSMGVNELGVKIRSEWLGIPFGDQGFCIEKKIFNRIGPFNGKLPYGEDHDFLWRAKIKGIRISNTGGAIFTSARKYKKGGWSKTTLEHLFCTYKQARPYWQKLREKRYL